MVLVAERDHTKITPAINGGGVNQNDTESIALCTEMA